MASQIRSSLGNIFDLVGTRLGLPELGISEAVAGGSTANTQRRPSVLGASTYQPQTSSPVATGPMSYANAPYSLPYQSGGGGGGGFTGGGAAPAGGGTPAAPPLEQEPSAPSSGDFDAAIAPALQALSQFEASLRPQFESEARAAEQTGQQQIESARGEEARRTGALQQQATREQGRGESAIAEAKRIASEQQRGLQSLYGGTTGTGRFAGEILGSQASRNIATNRAALQDTLGQIGLAEENVRAETSRIIKEVEQNTQLAKERLNNQLRQQLAEVASRRGELESRKAEMRNQALQNYNQLISDINARNTAFKQDLFLKQQRAQEGIDQMKNSALQNFQAQFENFQPPTFEVGGTTVGAFPTSSGGFTYISGKNTDDEQMGTLDELQTAFGL